MTELQQLQDHWRKRGGIGQLAGKAVRGFRNLSKQTIVPRGGQPLLAHRVPPQYAHLPVGSKVPGEVPMAKPRAFGTVATPKVPLPDDVTAGNHLIGGLGILGGVGAAGSTMLPRRNDQQATR